jgi:hypothetical protein
VFIYYDATQWASKPITEGRPAIRIDWHILQGKNLATRHVRLYLATNDRSSVRDNLSPSAKKARTVLPPSSGGPTCPRKIKHDVHSVVAPPDQGQMSKSGKRCSETHPQLGYFGLPTACD